MWRTIGFEQQKKNFEALVTTGTLSHAYMFQGPAEIGKKMFAEDMFVLANKREKFDAADPDLCIVAPKVAEGDTKIYVEDIRDLKSFLSLTPYYGPYRFVLIDAADRLTAEAANSFLKSLEEPSGKVVFILITSQPEQMLPTISSRCQHISFLPHLDREVAAVIAKKKLEKSDVDLLTVMARGRIGWATEAMQVRNLKSIKASIEEFKTVLASPLTERMLYAKQVYEKDSYAELVSYWLAWAYAERATLPNAHRVLSQLLTLHQYVAQPQYNHRLLLEHTLINL